MTPEAEAPLPVQTVPGPAWRAWLIRAGSIIWVLVLGIALHQLHREWSSFHFSDLNAALARIGPSHLAAALGFTLLSYACNAALGIVAQRWLGHPPLAPWRDLLRNFIVSAFTMNAGGSVIGGGSIRLRFAAEQGRSPEEVGKATLFSGLAGWAGHVLLSGLLLCFASPPLDWLPGPISRSAGVILLVLGLLLPFGALVWQAWPRPPLAALTMLVSMVDWLCAGLAMWALIPGALPISAASLVAIVVVSQALASLTHVPGGVGVLELALMTALAGTVPSAVLAGTLVTYRLLYYLLPFATAIFLLAVREVHRRRQSLQRRSRHVLKGWSMLAPRLATLLALGGGFLLLLSVNTPIEPARRGLVALLPLPFVEASHFISSLAGAILIVVARGLQRRVRSAWWISVAAMSGGIVFSITKGFDWEESLILSFLLLCLLSSKAHFHRSAALFTHRFTPGWWLMLLCLVGTATWVGFFATRNVPYQSSLWWHFALKGDAPRFLRAMTGASCILLIAALAQALRPAKKRTPQQLDPATLDTLVKTSSHTEAALAWLGDKDFTLSEDRHCALMHGDQGRSRIVLGDPLGDLDSADDLLWSFIEQAQDEGMRPVFYQVSVAQMPLLVDMGLKLYKLGEEASVNLQHFSLEGSDAKKLRQARSRFQRNGLTFHLWSPQQAAPHMAELRAISDAWLSTHKAAEKGFSLGYFDEAYLSHFTFAIVTDATGTLIAFANLWESASKQELSLDLMRYLPTAPSGVMEALFIEIMLWGQQQGYQSFSLGMAPLSGLSTHPLAPLWSKLAARIFNHSGQLYNFSGLRAYKEKFTPRWEPRYIAVPSAWSLPTALLDATALISGGLRRTFTRQPS